MTNRFREQQRRIVSGRVVSWKFPSIVTSPRSKTCFVELWLTGHSPTKQSCHATVAASLSSRGLDTIRYEQLPRHSWYSINTVFRCCRFRSDGVTRCKGSDHRIPVPLPAAPSAGGYGLPIFSVPNRRACARRGSAAGAI